MCTGIHDLCLVPVPVHVVVAFACVCVHLSVCTSSTIYNESSQKCRQTPNRVHHEQHIKFVQAGVGFSGLAVFAGVATSAGKCVVSVVWYNSKSATLLHGICYHAQAHHMSLPPHHAISSPCNAPSIQLTFLHTPSWSLCEHTHVRRSVWADEGAVLLQRHTLDLHAPEGDVQLQRDCDPHLSSQAGGAADARRLGDYRALQ